MVSGKVNEIQKLKESRDNAVFSVFISYSNVETYDKNLQMIQEEWGNRDYPLVIMLVTFMKQGIRWFEKLETHHLQGGKLIKHRSQPALPWHVKGSRWESRYAD